MNKWLGIGIISSKINIKKTKNNRDIAKFRIAVPRIPSKDNPPPVDIISCCAFDDYALDCYRRGKKGDRVGIVGKIYTISHTYNERDTLLMEIMIDYIEFLDEPTNSSVKENSLITAYYESIKNNE